MSERLGLLARNFVGLAGAQVAGRLVAFGVTVYLSRVLGVEGFGVIVFATSVLAYGSLVVDGGFDSLGQREIARRRIPRERLLPTLIGLRSLLVGAAWILLVIFAETFAPSELVRTVLYLYGLSLVTDAFDLRWLYFGAERPVWVGVGETVTQVVLLGGVVALVRRPEGLVLVPLAFLAGRVLGVALLWVLHVRRHGLPEWGFDRSLAEELIRDALPIGGAAAVGMLSHNFDTVLLGLWLGTSATGLYGAAYRVAWVPTTLAMAYLAVIRPTIARAAVTGGLPALSRFLTSSLRMTGAAGIGLVVLASPIAGEILGLLFGDPYRRAAPVLGLLLGATALVMVNRHFRALLVAFDRQREALVVMGVGGGVNVALNLLLIGPFGVVGAAAATAISEAVILALGAWATRLRVGPVAVLPHLARPALCGLPSLGLLLWPLAGPLALRAILAALLYPLLLLGTGAIRVREATAVVASLGLWTPDGR